MLKKLLNAAFLAALVPVAAAAAPTIDLALDAAQDLRSRARFPDSSQPILDAVDPIVAQRLPTRQSQAGPNGAAPRLSVWASTIAAEAGQSVDLFAQLENADGAPTSFAQVVQGLKPIAATVSAQLAGERSGELATLSYLDDGRGPDLRAGDGIYSARYTLPAARAPALGTADSVIVKVQAWTQSGEYRAATGGFQFSNPGARLTGVFRDAVRDGNLTLAAEVEVLKAGRYHLSGTLANALKVPVAQAQSAQVLQPGKQWLELSYYGLVFQDRGLAGKLSLAAVSLTSTGGMPNALGPVLQNAHLTQPLNLAALTRAPYNHPELLEAARRLEAELVVPGVTRLP